MFRGTLRLRIILGKMIDANNSVEKFLGLVVRQVENFLRIRFCGELRVSEETLPILIT